MMSDNKLPKVIDVNIVAIKRALAHLEDCPAHLRGWSIDAAILELQQVVKTVESDSTADKLQTAVTRFLSWPLPKDFYPDCYITFNHPEGGDWPTGTNLLHAGQVKNMLEYIIPSLTLNIQTPHD